MAFCNPSWPRWFRVPHSRPHTSASMGSSVAGNKVIGRDFRPFLLFRTRRKLKRLSITWLDLSDFEPSPLARHFVYYGSSLRSPCMSYISPDYSTLMTFLQLFPYLKYLLVRTPDLCDDNLPPRMLRTTRLFRGFLNVLPLCFTSGWLGLAILVYLSLQP